MLPLSNHLTRNSVTPATTSALYLSSKGKEEEDYVSTLMMYLSSGVAGLHAVSTLPKYRGKGLGLSISRKALTDAFKIGYKVGVLQASSLGERVYRKLGFQKYCDIISYALVIE